MMSTRRGEGVRSRWTHVVERRGWQVDVHKENYSPLSSSCLLMQRIWRFLYQNFVFGIEYKVENFRQYNLLIEVPSSIVSNKLH